MHHLVSLSPIMLAALGRAGKCTLQHLTVFVSYLDTTMTSYACLTISNLKLFYASFCKGTEVDLVPIAKGLKHGS